MRMREQLLRLTAALEVIARMAREPPGEPAEILAWIAEYASGKVPDLRHCRDCGALYPYDAAGRHQRCSRCRWKAYLVSSTQPATACHIDVLQSRE